MWRGSNNENRQDWLQCILHTVYNKITILVASNNWRILSSKTWILLFAVIPQSIVYIASMYVLPLISLENFKWTVRLVGPTMRKWLTEVSWQIHDTVLDPGNSDDPWYRDRRQVASTWHQVDELVAVTVTSWYHSINFTSSWCHGISLLPYTRQQLDYLRVSINVNQADATATTLN